MVRPSDNRDATESAITAFLDLMFEERGHKPLTAAQAGADSNRRTWSEYLMPVHAIQWTPPSSGSQKSLVPDLWLEWDATTLIVDAKYKRHWEEMQRHQWPRVEELLREQHRQDLLQVLAYANLARTQSTIVCLVYPCSVTVWTSLCERGRLIHCAELTMGERSLHLWLTAVPMAADADRVAIPIATELRKILNKW